MSSYLPEPWERDALLAQADKAAGWLTVCPRDDWPLTLQPDGTETCPECGWHTGDPIVPPEVVAQRLADARHRRAVLRDGVLFVCGFVLFVAGIAWNEPVTLLLAASLMGLPWVLHHERKPHDGPPEPVTKGLVRGRGKAPTQPPPPAHPPSAVATCIWCGGATDTATKGWCGTCQNYSTDRIASAAHRHVPAAPARSNKTLHPCSVCGVPTLSTSSECPSCEVHDGAWSYEIERNEDRIVASYAVPPVAMYERWPGPVKARLHAAITAAETTIPLDRRSPWREGALVEVCIDPGTALAEAILVRAQGTVLMVECRGYDDTLAVAHMAGAEIATVVSAVAEPKRQVYPFGPL